MERQIRWGIIKVDNTGENGKNIKEPYPIFDMSSMYYYPK